MIMRKLQCCILLGAVLETSRAVVVAAQPLPGADQYRAEILPILEDRCFDCHGDGMSKGSMALDEFSDDADLLGRLDLWLDVTKNVRARIMPPSRKPQLTEEERSRLLDWAQRSVFKIDPDNPDPGRVTIRRLNRVEYRNTIRDLMGVDFDTELEFPADDTGYGFDNIGDVLSISPLLLEKYVRAAQSIVDEAVPRAPRERPELVVQGAAFESSDGRFDGDRISFYDAAILTESVEVEHPGEYEVEFVAHVDGEFAFDPGRVRGIFSLDGEEIARDEFVYAFSDDPDRGASFHYSGVRELEAGSHELRVDVQPLTPIEEKLNRLDFRIKSAALKGPADESYWREPEGYRKFFPEGPAPDGRAERREYAERILGDFGLRAFRSPVSESALMDLARMAADVFEKPERSFEDGIAQAMVAMLASPRFLFRIEDDAPDSADESYPLIDEWALASRLSYFLWSTMPDEALFQLAAEGRLRERLSAQIERMIQDPRSSALIENFTGQWLQARNIQHIPIEPLAVLGLQEEMDSLREEFRGRLFGPRDDESESPELIAARARWRELFELSRSFDKGLRESMRLETEKTFEYTLRENRSVSEFLDSDHTFLNERLAEHYGIEGVVGDEMRRVALEPGDPRGGVLTQGNMLLVTSNPTRTSPVKRGLFILENILGTPTPPAPPNIPALEEAAEEIGDHEPTLRELMSRHREDPLCSSCHQRIDPLGLAFENFSALGTWREQESGQTIDPAGSLITGESFQGVAELKGILLGSYRENFYRCLTEKLLTYALGRGVEYYDEYTVDRIVERLENEGGRFHALIEGIVDSAPFQKRRRSEPETADGGNVPGPDTHFANRD